MLLVKDGGAGREARPAGPSMRREASLPPAAPILQIDRWYTRKARVASHMQTSVNTASQPMRVKTRLQSGVAARPDRPASTAQFTGLYRATL